MHMADALLSPAVGGSMWAASAGIIACCSRNVRDDLETGKIPLMGVLGAFIFAAQMITFAIPATGSSGHLGGGMILSVLLGPSAAFLTIASVLVVQALFFADGGLLALGCNIFNLGFFPAFIAYPFIYRPIAGSRGTRGRIVLASLASAVIGLQLGACGVVFETTASGISALPFPAFAALMLPLHLGIGIVEGAVTAAVVLFVFRARPELLPGSPEEGASSGLPMRQVVLAFLATALLTGGFVSRFASGNPDGLEWSIQQVAGKDELGGEKGALHGALAGIQERVALLPEYAFRKPEAGKRDGAQPAAGAKEAAGGAEGRPGASVAGVVGAVLTLALALITGMVLKKLSPSRQG